MAEKMDQKYTLKAKLSSYAFVIVIAIFPSPYFQSLYSLFNIFVCFSLPFLVLLLHGLSLSKRDFVIISLVLIVGLIGSLTAQSHSQIALASLLVATIIFAKGAFSIDFRKVLRILNFLMFLLLFGAVFAVVYFVFGGEPITSIQNPDGRSNYLFLTSLTNSADYLFWGIIRVSGIYDEPGAFSFILCLVVVLNELYRPRSASSVFLMTLGLVTLSLAHFILCVLYYVYYFRSRRVWKRVAGIVFLLSFVLMPFLYFQEESVISRTFLNRFEIQEGRLAGDNRTPQIEVFYELVSKDPRLSIRGHQTLSRELGQPLYLVDQSSNPFSIWYNYGLILWTIYAALLIYLLSTLVSSRLSSSMTLSGIFLLLTLLQRPYIFNPAWAPALTVVIYFYICSVTSMRRTTNLALAQPKAQ